MILKGTDSSNTHDIAMQGIRCGGRSQTAR